MIQWPGTWVCIFLLAWYPVVHYAQVTCTGTFGDNIFLEGDFGSGSVNILPNVTGLAPGYTYTTNTPPEDGYFTITNNMGRWGSNYDTWLNVGDNSPDPNGYMMVVNASYSPGIFYEQTIDNLCPNTTFEFSADILNVVRPEVSGHSLPDLEFLINDSVWYATGEIPQDGQWHKHGFTFSLEPDQSSLKLTLVNKAPGGIGNDLALDNITFRPCGPDPDTDFEEKLVFCEEENGTGLLSTDIDLSSFSIQWQRKSSNNEDWMDVGAINALDFPLDLTLPGIYNYRFKISNSRDNLGNPQCVSFSNTVEVEVQPRYYVIHDTICEGTARPFGEQILTNPGRYRSVYKSVQGCDSIVVLYLTIVPALPITFDLDFDHPSCHRYTDGWIEIENAQGGHPPYQFVLNSDIRQAGRFENLDAGLKTVLIRDRFGCQLSSSVRLIDPPSFDLASIPDTQIILGEPLTIQIIGSEPITSLVSEPDILANCNPCTEVTFIPFQSTEVNITATNGRGCSTATRFHIQVDDQNLPIGFPNAFTPNGDGINDDFRIYAPSYLITRILDVRIMDRWGNEVFSNSGEINPGEAVLWDGYYGQSPCEPGLYAYLCEVELINGETRYFSGEILVTGL